MFDKGKVLLGLLIFLALFTFPLWYNAATGRATHVPDLVYPDPAAHGENCVLDKEYMKHSHMDLLNQWRDDVVRRGERVYTTADGKRYVMSLQNTCLSCHANKAQFCDQCHDYLGVSPYCWECHIEPEGNQS